MSEPHSSLATSSSSSAGVPSIWSLSSPSSLEFALAAWKAEWTRLNAARRRRAPGRPELAMHPIGATGGTVLQASDPAAMNRPSTRAAGRHSAAASPASSRHTSPHSSPLKNSNTSGLFSSSTYRSPSSLAPPPSSSTTSSPSSSPASSPSRAPSKHGSRMHAAAMAMQATEAAAAATMAGKRKAKEMSGSSAESSSVLAASSSSTAMEDIAAAPADASSAIANNSMSISLAPLSPYHNANMIALRPTAAAADDSPSERTTASKKPRLSSLLASVGSKLHLIAPRCASPPLSPVAAVSSTKSSPSKPKDLFSAAAGKKRVSAKLAGKHTPGLHNSTGILSFTVGDDTPEDREKKAWMQAEYDDWMAKKAERNSAQAKGARRTHVPPLSNQTQFQQQPDPYGSPQASAAAASSSVDAMDLSSSSSLAASHSTPLGLAPVGQSTYSAPLPFASEASRTPPSRSSVAASHRPVHPSGAGAVAFQTIAGTRVRRSLFEELERSATPRAPGTPVLSRKGEHPGVGVSGSPLPAAATRPTIPFGSPAGSSTAAAASSSPMTPAAKGSTGSLALAAALQMQQQAPLPSTPVAAAAPAAAAIAASPIAPTTVSVAALMPSPAPRPAKPNVSSNSGSSSAHVPPTRGSGSLLAAFSAKKGAPASGSTSLSLTTKPATTVIRPPNSVAASSSTTTKASKASAARRTLFGQPSASGATPRTPTIKSLFAMPSASPISTPQGSPASANTAAAAAASSSTASSSALSLVGVAPMELSDEDEGSDSGSDADQLVLV